MTEVDWIKAEYFCPACYGNHPNGPGLCPLEARLKELEG